jgi:hypothetical protein
MSGSQSRPWTACSSSALQVVTNQRIQAIRRLETCSTVESVGERPGIAVPTCKLVCMSPRPALYSLATHRFPSRFYRSVRLERCCLSGRLYRESFGNNESVPFGVAHDWRGTRVEGSRFALCEVSHHDSSAPEHRERCPGGWHSEAAPTHWPPGRKEEMGWQVVRGKKLKNELRTPGPFRTQRSRV